MKRLIHTFAAIFGCASACWGAASAPLTSLQAIQSLTIAQASQRVPVAFEATVTYFRWYENTLFVQDGDRAIYVQTPSDVRVAPGDRVLVRGKTHDSYRTEILGDSVTLLHHGALPKSVPADFDTLIRGQLDSMEVTVHGVVRTADLSFGVAAPVRSITLQMFTDGGIIQANVDSDDANVLKDLLDSEVEVTGVTSGRFDGKMQLVGLEIDVPTLDGVKILKRAGTNPWSLPVTPMDKILSGYHDRDLTQRILVHGVITYYQPGVMLVMQNGTKSLRIMTQAYTPLRIGDVADATGFPDLHDGFLTLKRAEIQDSQLPAPITPLPTTFEQLSSSNYIFDLVSIEGQVVMEVREASQDEYVLVADGHLFSAVYHHPDASSRIPLPAMTEIPVGARIRVTGTCMPYRSDPFNGPVPFDILLRSFDDVSVVASPSLLTVRNLVIFIGFLLAVMFAGGTRAWITERKIRRQNAASAYIERRRSRILEDIYSSRPLAEILEEITELVSFKLRGAPCWCKISDGAQLGNCPPKMNGMRIAESEIRGHTGPSAGTLFAALDRRAKPSADEVEALSMAVGLAALAIETRHLYSDLRRRSEFDLLTDIHNRFSLERYLDELITDARQNAGIFGLIYVDLNEFKQVNDRFGHQAGDLYLQEVALRLKHELRNVDMLARLGGDEFALLLPKVRNRYELEAITRRLEHCFNQPFSIAGQSLQGSASFGMALYPEDATTADALFSAADAAMYMVKSTRKEMKSYQPLRKNPRYGS